MNEIVTLAQVEEKLISIRGQSVLLDSDVAALYAVETRAINQAIQRNPGKFPEGYIFHLTREEWNPLKSQIATLSNPLITKGKTGEIKNCDLLPGKTELVANCDQFTGKPLKSQTATLANPLKTKGKAELITNCDKFNLKHFPGTPHAFTEKGLYMLATILKGPRAVRTTLAIVEAFAKIRELARTVARLADTTEKFQQKSLMQKSGEIMADILGDAIKTTDTETNIELNLAILKFKHTIKRKST